MDARDQDPAFRTALQRQAMNGAAPIDSQPAGQVWAAVSKCPDCGAPIWFCAAAPAQQKPPEAYFSCACGPLKMEKARREHAAMMKGIVTAQ